jgi:hypothetical protein
MASATTTGKRLVDEEFARLVTLMKDADSVELKLTVPEPDHRSTLAALGLDPLDAQIRQVYFFDTPDLALDKRGIVVRARRVQRKGDDTVVKLRPVVPHELPASVRRAQGFGVEVDVMPGGFVCSGSFKGTHDSTAVKQTLARGKPLRKLFTKEQRSFFAEHAPDGIALDDLSVLGPIFVLKVRFALADFDRRLVAELWLYPNDSRIMELSTKCAPSEAFDVAVAARAALMERGVDLSGDQQTKTRTALMFFSQRLQEAQKAG